MGDKPPRPPSLPPSACTHAWRSYSAPARRRLRSSSSRCRTRCQCAGATCTRRQRKRQPPAALQHRNSARCSPNGACQIALLARQGVPLQPSPAATPLQSAKVRPQRTSCHLVSLRSADGRMSVRARLRRERRWEMRPAACAFLGAGTKNRKRGPRLQRDAYDRHDRASHPRARSVVAPANRNTAEPSLSSKLPPPQPQQV